MTATAQPEMLFTATDGCSAELSPDRVYRYTLTRQWSDGRCIAWLMFNPSTADESVDDHTIRKCIGFSRRWGYGRLVILNLYAIRSTDPRAVARISDPVGPMNDYWIKKALDEAREVICAWGCAQHAPTITPRIDHVLNRVATIQTSLMCLGYRKDGHPRHPLMVAYTVEREAFNPPGEARGGL